MFIEQSMWLLFLCPERRIYMSEDKKQPEKGINLRIQEIKEDIADVVNKSQLPPSILLMILGEFTAQIQVQNARMIELERKAYEEEVKKHGKEIRKA
jgi:uncharacterized protein YejL (UPF0352 family)